MRTHGENQIYSYIHWTKKDVSIENTGFGTWMMATWGKGGHGISACTPGMVFSIATVDSREYCYWNKAKYKLSST